MQHEFRPVTVDELEGKRRKDIEAGLVKRDVKRQKIQENHDVPAALAKAAEVNDPIMVRRRGKMMLPAPQISEVELEQIARMSTDAMLDEQVCTRGRRGAVQYTLLLLLLFFCTCLLSVGAVHRALTDSLRKPCPPS